MILEAKLHQCLSYKRMVIEKTWLQKASLAMDPEQRIKILNWALGELKYLIIPVLNV